jgi:Flp pilus assembly CpaE family ATPase
MNAIPVLFFFSIALIALMAVATEVAGIRSGIVFCLSFGRVASAGIVRLTRELRSGLSGSFADSGAEDFSAGRNGAGNRRGRPVPQKAPDTPPSQRDVLSVYENSSAVERLAGLRQIMTRLSEPLVDRAPDPVERAAPEPELPAVRERPQPVKPKSSAPRQAAPPPEKPAPPSSPERPAPVEHPEHFTPQPPLAGQRPSMEMESESGRDVFARLADVSRFNEGEVALPMDEIPADDKIQSSVIVFLHVAGGVGATTFAVNTACSLAGPRRNCCLMDLDVQFGGVASLLDLPPSPALQALMQDPRRLERVSLESMLVRHSTGVHVLTAPRVPIPLHGLKASAISELIQVAKSRFTYVVVDMPLALTTWTDAVLRPARLVYLVTPITVQAAHRTARLLHLMKQQELAELPIKIIANRYNSAGSGIIGPKQFAKAIGREIDHLVPNDYEMVLQSHNQGVPVVKMAPKAKFSQAIAKILAEDFNEVSSAQSPRKFAGFDR